MKQLQLGKISTKELADWFGYSYNTFRSKKKPILLEHLKDYCDFELYRGYILVKEIYIDEYEGDLSQDVQTYLEEVRKYPLNSISNIANSIIINPQYAHLSEKQREKRMRKAGVTGFGVTAEELSKGIYGSREYVWAVKLVEGSKPYRYMTTDEEGKFRSHIKEIFDSKMEVVEKMALLDKEFETTSMTKDQYLNHKDRIAFKETFSSVLYRFKQETGLTLVRATQHEIETGCAF